MSNTTSNALIQQLLKAEQEADEIIKKANDAKIKLLNDAEKMAQDEIENFKKHEDGLFQKKLKELPNENDSSINQLREETEQMIAKYRQRAAKISDSLVEFLVQSTITVNIPQS